ncbi:MAG: hypothetical protein ACHQPI_08365 [Thermoanaerobaculia bacterium]
MPAGAIPTRALTVLACTAVLFVRKPDAFTNPQLFAEDGTIFFAQQLRLGWRAHLASYAGYFHEVPRLIASFADLFPYRFAPGIYAFAALLAILVLVVKLHSDRLGLPLAPAFAIGVVLVPHFTGEVFLSVTNVQWFLALLLLVVAAQASPRTLREAVPDWLTALLAGLTGPFAPLLFPAFVARSWRDRSRLGGVTAGLVGVTGTIQTLAFLRAPVFVPASPSAQPGSWLDLLGRRCVGMLFLGVELPYRISPLLLVAGGVAVTGLVIRVLWTRSTPRVTGLLFMAFAAAVTALSFLKFRHAPDLLVPPGAAARYFFVGNVVAVWCLLLATTSGRGFRRLLPGVLLAAIFVSSLRSGFRTPPPEDFAWRHYAGRIGSGAPLSIPINPPGWRIELPGK